MFWDLDDCFVLSFYGLLDGGILYGGCGSALVSRFCGFGEVLDCSSYSFSSLTHTLLSVLYSSGYCALMMRNTLLLVWIIH